jgi:hypothetical protein
VPSFDEAWAAAARARDGESISPKLRSLLQEVYSHIVQHPEDLAGLKRGLQHLLEFLNSDGRTNANCWAADLFFGLCEGWERDWGDLELPEEFHDVLARMGEALHDTVQAPSFARNFGCLPEQLLEQVGRLRIDLPMSDDTSE